MCFFIKSALLTLAVSIDSYINSTKNDGCGAHCANEGATSSPHVLNGVNVCFIREYLLSNVQNNI